MKQKRHNKAHRTHSSRSSLRGVKRRREKVPTTARQYFSMPEKDQETWDSIAHVVSRVREGVSITRASEEFGIEPKIAIDRGRAALRKKSGRYVATKTDRLLRVLAILSTKGRTLIATRDSRQASLVGGHWAAVQRYLQTGDDSALLRFKGKRVADASGKRHLFLTDLKELDRQAAAGVLSFESMYAGGAR